MRRRGTIYVAVLGVSMLVVAIGLGAMAASRVDRRAAVIEDELGQARLNAQAGVELAADWVATTPTWRTQYASLVGASTGFAGTLALPQGTTNATVVDPVDGDLGNWPYDPAVISGTGRMGGARQMVEARLEASPVALPIVSYAVATRGGVEIPSGGTLRAGTVYADGALRLDGSLLGNVVAQSRSGGGTLSGTLTLPSPTLAFPSWVDLAWYVSRATTLPTITTINRDLIAAGINTEGGMLNAEGIYALNTGGNITISFSRIQGTLVINAGGNTVRVEGNVVMRPHRAGMPVLIVNGNVELAFNSPLPGVSDGVLTELFSLRNFNPPQAPFEGGSDNDLLDSYESEIRGLIYATGQIRITGRSRVRGAVVSASTASDAVRVDSDCEVLHDAGLVAMPPVGFTERVDMVLAPGSWQQVVQP